MGICHIFFPILLHRQLKHRFVSIRQFWFV